MEAALETTDESVVDDNATEVDGEDAAPEERTDGRPEHCPEKFWDHENGIIRTEAMLKSYAEIEKAYKEKSASAKVPDEYDLEIPSYDDVADDLEGVGKDEFSEVTALMQPDCPFSRSMRGRAKEAGLSQEQFDTFAKGFIVEQARGHQFQVNEARKALLKEEGGNEKALSERLAGLGQAVRNVYRDDPKKMAAINLITHLPEGIKVLEDIVSGKFGEKLRSNGSSKPIPMEAGKPARLSQDDVRQMMNTEAYQSGDPAAHKKVAEAWQSLERAGALK